MIQYFPIFCSSPTIGHSNPKKEIIPSNLQLVASLNYKDEFNKNKINNNHIKNIINNNNNINKNNNNNSTNKNKNNNNNISPSMVPLHHRTKYTESGEKSPPFLPPHHNGGRERTPPQKIAQKNGA